MKKSLKWTIGLVTAAAIGTAYWVWQSSQPVALQYKTAPIERGNLQSSVSASGSVSPVGQVSVGTQVSGQIKEIYVDFNSPVTAGQLIAQIDPETFEYRLRSVQADLDSALAQSLGAQANVNVSKSQVAKAQLDWEEAKRDAERKSSLVEKGFIATSEADKAKSLAAIAAESLKIAQAQLSLVQAQAKAAQALVAQRQSSVSQAKIDLERTNIRSPINGIVIKRAVEKGQTVAASLQSPELFVIAQNLSDMQVEASIDESDIGKVKVGQKASFTVDAFAGQSFEGLVKQVRKAAQNVSNVVTYNAIVSFSNTNGQLLPGMTANVRLITESKDNVLKIPNAALRVKIAGIEPEGKQLGAYQPLGIPATATSFNSSLTPSSSGSISIPSLVGGLFPSAHAQNLPGAPTSARSGGIMAMKERLTQALDLTVSQQEQVEELMQQARPQFMALRNLRPEQGLLEREKLMRELEKSINSLLTPEQKTKYKAWLAKQDSDRRGQVVKPSAQTSTNSNSAFATDSSFVNKPAEWAPSKNISKSSSSPAAGALATASSHAQTSTTHSASAATNASSAQNSNNNAISGSAGPMAGFANRLNSELGLSASQQAAVESIMSQVRPQMMALRDLPEADRGKARERIMSEMRAQIGDLLTPEQKVKYQVILAESASRQSSRGKIYILRADGSIKAFQVRLGISNGSFTELMVPTNSPEAAELKEGAQVIVGLLQKNGGNVSGRPESTSNTRSSSGTGPRMPF